MRVDDGGTQAYHADNPLAAEAGGPIQETPVTMKAAILDDYQGVAPSMADWSRLPGHVEATFYQDHLSSEDALVERLVDYEIVVAMRERTPFTRAIMHSLPNLKLLITTGMNNPSIDFKAATEHGIVVCGTHGVPTDTGELTWGLILALTRQIPLEDKSTREGAWQRTVGMGLAGKTLGIVGLGRIGSQVARIAHAFEMKTLAWSPNLTAERAADAGADYVPRDELLARSDIVSLHIRLSERTKGMFGKAELALMKPGALLINTSRGPLVDEAALIDALQSGHLAGAALDVFDTEPLPSAHALRSLANTVITPHLAYVTTGTYQIMYTHAIEDIEAYIAGAPLRVLNKSG